MKPTQPVTLRGAFLPVIKQQQILIFSEVLTLRFHYAISTLSLEQVAKACCHAKKVILNKPKCYTATANCPEITKPTPCSTTGSR